MNNLGEQLLGIQPVLAVLISGVFLLLLLMDKDELEQFAFNYALKTSSAITIISLLGYSLYMMTLGYNMVNIHVIYFGIEGMSILTLLLYYLNLKGISLEIRSENKVLSNILIYISICVSALATLSILFQIDFLDNTAGYIRYDELILLVNVVLLTCLIPILPKTKKVDRETYKKIKKDVDRQLNIMGVIYVIIMALMIFCIVKQKVVF